MAHWKVEKLALQKWTHKILNILKEKVTKNEETQSNNFSNILRFHHCRVMTLAKDYCAFILT
jgi:hypothetical protein